MNIIQKLQQGLIYAKGGGGGGGSGVVDYPDYMEAFHSDLLNHTGVDGITSSLIDVMNVAIGGSPFVAANAYDPDIPIAAMLASVEDLNTLVTLLSNGTTLDTLIADVLDDARIDTAVTEFSEDLGDRLTSEVLPRFEAGMRDINAVVSSAFAIGRAVIETQQTRQVAKYSADLHMKLLGDNAIQVIGMKLEYQRMLTHMEIEANRLKIVAKKEQNDTDIELDESDASWDLGVFQHGGNLLAGIGGGVVGSDKKKKNQAVSAIGGAMSGAAAGAMIGAQTGAQSGGYYGAAIGAVLGAAMGMME